MPIALNPDEPGRSCSLPILLGLGFFPLLKPLVDVDQHGGPGVGDLVGQLGFLFGGGFGRYDGCGHFLAKESKSDTLDDLGMVDGTGHARVFEIMSLAAMALFDEESITTSIARLRDRGLSFAPGLSDAEVSSIEAELEFVFPPELRFFLQMALPTSPYFVNWRAAPAKLRYWFDKQTEGVLFDVQNHVFWHDDWGPRPMDVLEAVALAKEELTSVPKLIPIGDRIFTKCVPATPCIAGNPIFSVNQTDVLHAGQNLGDYLQWFSRPTANFERDEENGESPTPLYSESYRSIEFWTDLVRWNMA